MTIQSKQKSFSIEANTKSTHADIYLYGVVGGWQVNIQRFRDELKQHKSLKTINVYISTLGGTFMDGLPIYNELKQHSAHVTTVNMGYALSMGSVIMLAGNTIKMAQNSLQMLHSPNTFMWDSCNANELRKVANTLDVHEKAMIPRYRERLNLSESAVQAILSEETWYTADEALSAGLIDEIIDPINFDEVEEQMTEDHWRQTVAMIRNQPPEPFMNRLIQHVPEAKARFEQNQHQAPTGQDIEDDTMTPEQQAALEQSMKDSIAQAAEDGAAKALAGLDEKIESAVSAAVKPLNDSAEAAAEKRDLVSGVVNSVKEQLGLVENKLTKLTEDQEKQGETLAAAKQVIDQVSELPVNKTRTPQVVDGEQPTEEEPYS